MQGKAKIVVLKIKEIFGIAVIALIALILIILLIVHIAKQKDNNRNDSTPTFNPGVYTASIILSGSTMDLELGVDEYDIKYISLVNTAESVETMYPLLSTCISDIERQLKKNGDLSCVSYSSDTKYTSIVLLNAINSAFNKAKYNGK